VVLSKAIGIETLGGIDRAILESRAYEAQDKRRKGRREKQKP